VQVQYANLTPLSGCGLFFKPNKLPPTLNFNITILKLINIEGFYYDIPELRAYFIGNNPIVDVPLVLAPSFITLLLLISAIINFY
jgi:hypothetical protein